MPSPPSARISFVRSQLSSLVASLADFCTLVLLTEVFHLWYLWSAVCGGVVGGVCNFLINRYWAFVSTQRSIPSQALRYALVSGGNLVLNTGGIYLLTHFLSVKYTFSKVLVSAFVGVTYSYLLNRKVVFK